MGPSVKFVSAIKDSFFNKRQRQCDDKIDIDSTINYWAITSGSSSVYLVMIKKISWCQDQYCCSQASTLFELPRQQARQKPSTCSHNMHPLKKECKNSLEKVRDLESKKCGSSAENDRQVVGGETKKMNASSLNK